MPAPLKLALARGRAVAFVGAGFSAACGMPRWPELIRQLLDLPAGRSGGPDAATLRLARAALDHGDYPVAAALLKRVLQPADLHEAVSTAFATDRLLSAPRAIRTRMEHRLRSLADGPWAGIITTNYDELIEWHLGRSGRLATVIATGDDHRLGSLMSSAQFGGLFLAKPHGSLRAGDLVLSTEDYSSVYLARRSVTTFLEAAMLRFSFVFLGCSLEDNIVTIRRQLSAMFEHTIPTAFALMPDSEITAARAVVLASDAQISTITYDEQPTSDTSAHLEFDRFLESCATVGDAGRQPDLMIETIRQAEPMAIPALIGTINVEILRIVASRPKISREDITTLERFLSDARNPVLDLSPSERLYRLLFLVSVGLVKETSGGGSLDEHGLTPRGHAVLATFPPSVSQPSLKGSRSR